MLNPNWSVKADTLYYDFDINNKSWNVVIARMSIQARR